MRIGIDVGGTHTDAVILDGEQVVGATKALTSADVIGGVTAALDEVLAQSGVTQSHIETVMIGTTQFTNAIVERRELSKIAVIRIGLPSGRGMPPMVDWPRDMVEAIGAQVYMLHGGYLYNGWPVAEMREDEISKMIKDILAKGIKNIAIASVFSPMNSEPETVLAERLRKAVPDARICLIGD